LGVKPENLFMVDSRSVISEDRTDLNIYKQPFARKTKLKTLEDALKGADVFLGLSKAGLVSKKMLQSMAKDPIVFAMANPDPEISYEDATDARDDVIMATGRSDYPNQVNNVLGFPFIFRGALDVKAKSINEEMKKAAVYALAELAKREVPETVNLAYKSKNLVFGKEYIIPKPLDPRLITTVTPAVAKAAMETGVARYAIKNWATYKIELMKRMGIYNQLIKSIRIKAKQNPKKIVFGDADNYNVLKAVQVTNLEHIARPILLGNEKEIKRIAKENQVDIEGLPIIDNRAPKEEKRIKKYAQILFEKRQRKGLTYQDSYDLMYNRNYFGAMMVETGDADGFLCGYSTKYTDTIKPALQIVGTNNSLKHIAGMYIVMTKKGPYFFSDTTVNIRPSARTIADTTLLTANEVRKFNMVPKIAIVSYSNFGAIREGSPDRAREAVEILHRDYPDLIVDGEMQANYAFNKELRINKFPFTKLKDHDVNTIIFPNLSAGNIAYKMMQEIGEAEVIGPIMVGIRKPIHVMQMGSSVREIENMAAISVLDAQTTSRDIVQL